MKIADDMNHGFATRAIHGGEKFNASAVPIFQAASVNEEYGRIANPTTSAFEEKIASLEGADGAFVTASGMAAVSQAILALTKQGDRIVYHRDTYSWAWKFFTELGAKFGLKAEAIDMTDLDILKDALKEKTRIVYFEPITNPLIDVIDVREVSRIAHEHGALSVIDSTFVTPYLMRPLELGVDVVLHSTTKYLSGHGDVIGGVMLANGELAETLHYARMTLGGIASPFAAFLMLRGTKTLPLRMDKHCSNATRLAEFLSTHKAVSNLRYPGLDNHPGHKLVRSQMKHFGAMMSFDLIGSWSVLKESLKLARPLISLGELETLVLQTPWREDIPDSNIRVSVGCEDIEDIIHDLDNALNTANAAT